MKSNLKHFFNKNGGVILAIVASLGVIATGIFAAKGGQKASKIIESAKNEKEEPLTKLETLKVVAKPYLPATVAGAATISAIIGSAILGKKQQASLIAAYIAMHESYRQYKNKVKDHRGEEFLKRIPKPSEIEKANPKIISTKSKAYTACLDVDVDEEIRLFYDAYGDKYFETTYGKVLQAQYHLNRSMLERGGDFVPLSWWYHFLGITDPIKNSEKIGWAPNDSYLWIEFDNRLVTMEDGLQCIFVNFVIDPEPYDCLMAL